MTTPIPADAELLDLGSVVLSQSGYELERGSLRDGFPFLFAEDRDSVVALGAVVAPESVMDVEPALSQHLTSRIATANAEAKRWDGYVILLTAARPDSSCASELARVAYNLNNVRRIVRVGIEPTRAAVARALRAVLPLTQITVDSALQNPLRSLETRLISDGLPPQQVAEAVRDFARMGATTLEPPGDADEDQQAHPVDDGDVSNA